METMERVPDGLREAYAADLGAAPYTADDVVAGGRARMRRRRVAAGGFAVAVAALAVGAINLAPLGGDRAEVTPPAATSGTTASTAAYPGCLDQPRSCVEVVGRWMREVGRAEGAARLVAADGYEAGTVVITDQVTVPLGQVVTVTVAIAPTTTAWADDPRSPAAPDRVVLPGLPGEFDRNTGFWSARTVETYDIERGRAYSKALRLRIESVDPDRDSESAMAADTPIPSWWNEQSVSSLVHRLVGPVPSLPEPLQSTSAPVATTPTGDCSRDPESCRAAFRVWTDTYHLNIGNYGTTTDASSGPGARLFTGTPVDNQVDPRPGIEMLVGGTDPGPQPGETRTTVAGLPAWTATRDTDVGVRTSLRFDAVDGKRGSVELSVVRPKPGPIPEALSDKAVTDLVRLVYGVG
jgi:hypothetical protein